MPTSNLTASIYVEAGCLIKHNHIRLAMYRVLLLQCVAIICANIDVEELALMTPPQIWTTVKEMFKAKQR